ncbi:peroxiredoxin [Streptomyces sp. IBSBF 2953]|uniref:peroxiredoxin n=1 Tax=Streptomyces TaxID=1883 RepID=UPI00211A0229|nr:peroxiredoxin [Streptomyces hayashii]
MTSIRLKPGDPAPQFSLPTARGTTLSLATLVDGPVILYAYPAALTPGCTAQACDFRDSLATFQASGIHVVGISPDAPEKLAEFTERDGIGFPLVSDVNGEVLTAYGAYFRRQRGDRMLQGVIRSTFVIGAGGQTITLAMYNVNPIGHVAQLRHELGID